LPLSSATATVALHVAPVLLRHTDLLGAGPRGRTNAILVHGGHRRGDAVPGAGGRARCRRPVPSSRNLIDLAVGRAQRTFRGGANCGVSRARGRSSPSSRRSGCGVGFYLRLLVADKPGRAWRDVTRIFGGRADQHFERGSARGGGGHRPRAAAAGDRHALRRDGAGSRRRWGKINALASGRAPRPCSTAWGTKAACGVAIHRYAASGYSPHAADSERTGTRAAWGANKYNSPEHSAFSTQRRPPMARDPLRRSRPLEVRDGRTRFRRRTAKLSKKFPPPTANPRRQAGGRDLQGSADRVRTSLGPGEEGAVRHLRYDRTHAGRRRVSGRWVSPVAGFPGGEMDPRMAEELFRPIHRRRGRGPTSRTSSAGERQSRGRRARQPAPTVEAEATIGLGRGRSGRQRGD